ncbi:MAG TPA: immunity 53 family protein [Terriglobales bacterium]|nr:immunity 53 family protein [Terriglobales bacterium]
MSLSALERWYTSQCNGEWEHSYGVKLNTLDNPGWRVEIDLRDTKKEGVSLQTVKIERTDDDWIHYWIEKRRFQIACGPGNLSEAIELFVGWFASE